MIKITRIETTYPPFDDDEPDYPGDGESSSIDDIVSFRELVDLLRDHSHPSCSHLVGDAYEWFSADTYTDPHSGEFTESSVHYNRENPTRMLKYWRLAMRAAGHRVA